MGDVDRVGGKNASLGEMISQLSKLGVRVPGGFATTAEAYRDFLDQSGLKSRIDDAMRDLDTDDIDALRRCGEKVRGMILETPFQADLQQAVEEAYGRLSSQHGDDVAVAVRSSATAEDLPDASFAGQQETFLNVRGLDAVLRRMHEVFASLYNDRAIAYRVHHGFDHEAVALSAGVQLMVRSDLGSSGVMFTLDTESGFDGVVFVTGSWGLGEMVVQGAVNPDEFYVYKQGLKAGHKAVLRRTRGSKLTRMVYSQDGHGVQVEDVPAQLQHTFCLDDEALEELARQALVIEQHYGRPMDIEWARDGRDGLLYIVQARPETVRSRQGSQMKRYRLEDRSRVLCEGRAIGHRIGSGNARVVADIGGMSQVEAGDVLVTDMTDPDWEPVMKRAAAIVTNRGGRTCHAAIIARELGIPAVVGCRNATELLPQGQAVTVSCAEGETGLVFEGELPFRIDEDELGEMPELPVKIMMNVANPDRAFDFCQIPNAGVGLARLEFIINRMIGIHPRALLEYEAQDAATRAEIDARMGGYPDPLEYYVSRLAEGIATISAAFAPKPVIVRLSDFKSNEYANLIGGRHYEPDEENPMLGFRGASRYLAAEFRECFELECRALRRVREEMGLSNTWAMVPFVRTVAEGRAVVELLSEFGLKRSDSLKIIMMCELPSNALQAEAFLELFDGFSIGSNDLTQLTLGLDRDSAEIADLFDERDPAVKALLSMAIEACRKRDRYIGICGQGPSDHADLAAWLMARGVGSMSLNPDTVVETWLSLAKN